MRGSRRRDRNGGNAAHHLSRAGPQTRPRGNRRGDRRPPLLALRVSHPPIEDAERLWRKLVELYEGEAWDALGYDSWRDYWIAEFGEQSLNLSYKQIAAGRVAKIIDNGAVYHGTKPNERQARELTSLLDEPEALREAWQRVVESNPEPTAAQVREVVSRHRPTLTLPLDEETLARVDRSGSPGRAGRATRGWAMLSG